MSEYQLNDEVMFGKIRGVIMGVEYADGLVSYDITLKDSMFRDGNMLKGVFSSMLEPAGPESQFAIGCGEGNDRIKKSAIKEMNAEGGNVIPKHKKITIKVLPIEHGYIRSGYKILDVDALGVDELPKEYIKNNPHVFLYRAVKKTLMVNAGDGCIYQVQAGDTYSSSEMNKIRNTCNQAGKRLHEINKRNREKAKIETWEW
jgi:hypothetical protein